MNRVDLHPEDLFDRARRGEASSQEAQRLHAHLESCPACRYEYTLAQDCAEGAAALPGDEALLARVRTGAASALSGSMLSRQGGRIRRRPSRVVFLAAAAVILLATLTAGATFARRAWNRTWARNVEQGIASDHSSATSRKPASLPAARGTVETDNAAEGSGRCAARDVRPGKIGRWRRSDSIGALARGAVLDRPPEGCRSSGQRCGALRTRQPCSTSR